MAETWSGFCDGLLFDPFGAVWMPFRIAAIEGCAAPAAYSGGLCKLMLALLPAGPSFFRTTGPGLACIWKLSAFCLTVMFTC